MGSSVQAISCFASEEICRLKKPHVAGHVGKIPDVTSTFLPPDKLKSKNNPKSAESFGHEPLGVRAENERVQHRHHSSCEILSFPRCGSLTKMSNPAVGTDIFELN